MAIYVDWTDDSHVCICQHHVGDWTVEEFIEAHKQVLEMRKLVSYPVHRIVDLLDSDSPPRDIIKALKLTVGNYDVRNTTTVYINVAVSNRIIIDLYSRLYNGHTPHMYQVATRDEAYTIINLLEQSKISNY